MKKVIILLVIVFLLLGCVKNNNSDDVELIINPKKYDNLGYDKLYSSYYDINNDGNKELLVIGENNIDKYIIDILYIGNNKELSMCNYNDCRMNIYDNGIIFNTVFNSYSDGIYIISEIGHNDNVYYYKYDTDTDYFIYDDINFKEKSKYQSINDLLDYYVKDSNKVIISELELNEI